MKLLLAAQKPERSGRSPRLNPSEHLRSASIQIREEIVPYENRKIMRNTYESEESAGRTAA